MESLWFFAIGLFLVILLFVFLRSFSRSGGRILVSSWGELQENQILIDLLHDYETKNPGVWVELERHAYTEYLREILGQINRGQKLDVLFVEVNNFVDFYFNGLLEPLDSYIKADGLDLKTFYPDVMKRFTVQNQTYAIPRDTAPWCLLYYNQAAFDGAGVPYPKADWTWNQFVEAAKALTKTDLHGKVVRWGFVEDRTGTDLWVYHSGGSYADNVNRPTQWTFTTDPNTRKGLDRRAELIFQHRVSPPSSVMEFRTDENVSDFFYEGKAAMFYSGLVWTPRFREIKNFKWDAALFPPGPTGQRTFPTGGSGYGILKSSRNKKEAWKFIRHLTSMEGASKMAANGLVQPALVELAHSEVFLDQKPPLNKKVLLDAVSQVQYSPFCSNWAQVHDHLMKEMEGVWAGREKMEDVMKRLEPFLKQNPPLVGKPERAS